MKALKIIEGITGNVEIGAIFTGKVTRLMTFGAFVEFLPGKEGLYLYPSSTTSALTRLKMLSAWRRDYCQSHGNR